MSDDTERKSVHIQKGVLAALEKTNAEMKAEHGITVTEAEAIRLGLLTYIRSAVQVCKGRQILTIGDVEQALTAHVKKRSGDN